MEVTITKTPLPKWYVSFVWFSFDFRYIYRQNYAIKSNIYWFFKFF